MENEASRTDPGLRLSLSCEHLIEAPPMFALA